MNKCIFPQVRALELEVKAESVARGTLRERNLVLTEEVEKLGKSAKKVDKLKGMGERAKGASGELGELVGRLREIRKEAQAEGGQWGLKPG